MDNGTLSASDVALLSGNNGGFGGWGDSSFVWILALLVLAGGGLGFGGNNGFANAIGFENLATSNEVQRGFDNQNLQAQTRDILSAVTSGTAQTVAATNESFHNITGALSDKYTELQRDIANVALGQANILAKQAECCCETQRAIDGVNYNNAINTASINQTTMEQTQKVLDAITGNRMADMQNQINELQLQNAMAGVLKYPNSWAYNAGTSPFCNTGCGCGCMNM